MKPKVASYFLFSISALRNVANIWPFVDLCKNAAAIGADNCCEKWEKSTKESGISQEMTRGCFILCFPVIEATTHSKELHDFISTTF